MASTLRIYPRDILNHLSVSNKMADTAFELISLCLVTSISSRVGGGAEGSLMANLVEHDYRLEDQRSS